MNRKRYVSLGVGILLASFSAQAQTIFTYGDHRVSKDDFISVYEKNNKGPEAKNTSLSEYLNLYAMFRMKVQEALDMRMDTTAAVMNELNNYKAQLTRSELVDKEVTQRLVAEAYDRMKKDIKVAHILIAVRPNEDSTRAKNLVDSLYNVLQQGEADFASLAKKYSDDRTTAAEGGEIGYITALQTPYPFETAAYNTAVGQFSKPFRTVYGYHILKVQAERPDPGQVQVAQILISSPQYKGKTARVDALATAEKIEGLLKNGASFDQLVEQYSDDRYTKDIKGVMAPFGIGKMAPDYEKAAFALKKPGDISQPVETEFGFHILKLIKRIPLQPLDSIKYDLTTKVKNDSREAEAKNVYMDKVKEQYHFKTFPENFQQLLTVTGKDTSKNLNPQRFPDLKQPLFELDGKDYTQQDFLGYAHMLTKGNFIGRKENVLKDLFSSYQNKAITDLQQEKLLASNPHLRDLIQEYKNGILLFDLMDKKVWNKATADTSGLNTFYEQHQDNYQWQPGFEGSVFSSSNKQALEKLQGYLNQGEDVELAMDKVNKEMNQTSGISRQSGRFAFSQFPIDSKTLQTSKASAVYENKGQAYGVVFVHQLFPNTQVKSMDDAKGFIVADYQDYLEKQWEQQLKARYPLKINDKELNKLEKKYH